VDVTASLQNIFDDEHAGFGQYTTGQTANTAIPSITWKKEVDFPAFPALDSTLRATLVWADPPGSALQSLLSLRADHSDGTYQYAPDCDINNVQKLVWPKIGPWSKVTLSVEAPKITPPNLTQDFAICWFVDKNI